MARAKKKGGAMAALSELHQNVFDQLLFVPDDPPLVRS
jgi:hypothetical protein